MTPPGLIYLAIGLLVARIELEKTQTRGYTWLQWTQFLVDAGRITLLWPLVLLVEKIEVWLKTELPEEDRVGVLSGKQTIENPGLKETIRGGEL